ncbi:MAG TPA: hypothetical protein VF139_05195 [Candidatus Polarisedimenticolaceae bacterium]
MIGMRWTQATFAAIVLVWSGGFARADEPKKDPDPPAPEATPAAATETPSGKGPWWGGRNLLYLEVGVGSDSIETFNATYQTDTTSDARNEFELTDSTRGRFVVGWTLPNERGRFSLVFEGVQEDSYRLDASGFLVAAAGGGTSSPPTGPLQWWSLTAEDGAVNSARNPPYWDFTDDANGNGLADPGEVRYLGADVTSASSGPSNLGNRLQTIDLIYGREWGGRRIWGNWSAGLRSFRYTGNIPTSAWLISLGAQAPPGIGYTDGLVNPLVVWSQDTEGLGPTGSGGINFGFSRRRVVLYAEARFAFLVQDLKTDSGDFLTYAFDSVDTIYPVPARLQKSLSKSVWNVQVEFGARFRVVENTHVLVSYRRASYMDTVLVPVQLIVPDAPQQAGQPATAQFNSRDFKTDVLSLGLSYQF